MKTNNSNNTTPHLILYLSSATISFVNCVFYVKYIKLSSHGVLYHCNLQNPDSHFLNSESITIPH